MSPTARSLQHLKALGYHAKVVEKWNPFAKIRQGGGWITLVNRPTDRHAVLGGVNGGQRDFSRSAETVH
jgi:hypothetical protein